MTSGSLAEDLYLLPKATLRLDRRELNLQPFDRLLIDLMDAACRLSSAFNLGTNKATITERLKVSSIQSLDVDPCCDHGIGESGIRHRAGRKPCLTYEFQVAVPSANEEVLIANKILGIRCRPEMRVSCRLLIKFAASYRIEREYSS